MEHIQNSIEFSQIQRKYDICWENSYYVSKVDVKTEDIYLQERLYYLSSVFKKLNMKEENIYKNVRVIKTFQTVFNKVSITLFFNWR